MSMDLSNTSKECRTFGLLVGSVFSGIGIWPLLVRGEPYRLWAISLGGLLVLLGVIAPSVLAPIRRAWMWVGHLLGLINTRILLCLVFYGLITPMALLFRILGKDVMRRTFSQDSWTYRVIRQPRPRGHMRYQF